VRRREVLGLVAAVAAAGCGDQPGGQVPTTAGPGRTGADASVDVGPVDVQPSILGGDSAFDVRGSSGGAFVRVPVRLTGPDGTPGERGAVDERLLSGLSVDLDGRTVGDATIDRARGRWDLVLAVEVPTGEYGEGEVLLDAGGDGGFARVPIPRDALAALADPPAFDVRDFVVSDPIELQFLVVTMTVENAGGADGRFLAGLGPTSGPSPVVVTFDVPDGERVTQTRNLTLYHPPGGPVTVRLQWGRGSADRRVVLPGT